MQRANNLLRLSRVAGYCDQLVCLSVRENISGTAGPIFTKFCAQIPCGPGSVLLLWRCDTLCTSCFMDDVTFSRIRGRYGATCVATPAQSLMSTNALFLIKYTYIVLVSMRAIPVSSLSLYSTVLYISTLTYLVASMWL